MKRGRSEPPSGRGRHDRASRLPPTPLPPEPSDPRFVLTRSHTAPLAWKMTVVACPGLTVFRRKACTAEQASAVYAELHSEQASRLAWTALRDGGNPHSLLDTLKCYCGNKEAMLARGGRYKQQLLVRGRRADPLLTLPAITQVRERALALATQSIAECGLQAETPTSCDGRLPPSRLSVSLLTEQLIKYLPSDRWFAPHWDKDRRDKSSEPLDPKAYDGPGDALATLCLGCPCTLIMLPRRACRTIDTPGFALELQPGDLYVLAEEARWDWKHGIAVSATEMTARCAVVWRLLVDEVDETPNS